MHRQYFLQCERRQLCFEILKRLQVEVMPRKSDFRENRVSSLNKITWTLNLGAYMNFCLAQDFNLFYTIGLFLTP